MKNRRHRILDHPIIGYFVLAVIAQIIVMPGSAVDSLIEKVFLSGVEEGAAVQESFSGIGTALFALIALGIFYLWFRPQFDGCLKTKGLLTGLLFLLPFLIFHYTGSVVSWMTYGTGSVFVAFLASFAPGFGEEVIFRGYAVANYMRTIKSSDQIKVIFFLSSIVFGLVHLANIIAGGDPFSCIIQSVYACGVGMLFVAVYLRTGSLWPTIIGHFSVDFMELMRGDLAKSGGLMMEMGIGDWITIAAGAFGAIWGLRLIGPAHREQIMELWRKKWNRGDEEAESQDGPDGFGQDGSDSFGQDGSNDLA